MQVTLNKSHYCFALCQHVWPLVQTPSTACAREKGWKGKHSRSLRNSVYISNRSSQCLLFVWRSSDVVLSAVFISCLFYLSVCPEEIMTSFCSLTLIHKAHIRTRFWFTWDFDHACRDSKNAKENTVWSQVCEQSRVSMWSLAGLFGFKHSFSPNHVASLTYTIHAPANEPSPLTHMEGGCVASH